MEISQKHLNTTPKKNNRQNIKKIAQAVLISMLMAIWANTSYAQNTKQKLSWDTQILWWNTELVWKSSSQEIVMQDTTKMTHEEIVNTLPYAIYQKYGKEKATKMLQEAVLIEVNILREKHGKKPLKIDWYLSQKAQEYAESMFRTKHYSHIDPQWRGPMDRVNVGWHKYMLVENLKRAPFTILQFLDSQMKSPGHRDNIISKDHDFSWFWFGNKWWYFVMLFAL